MEGIEEMPKPVQLLAWCRKRRHKVDGLAAQYCGLVKIGAYARIVSEGGTYHPIYIWLAFRVWIPRMLMVCKVGVKVGLKQPLGVGFILQDLANLALWVWVQYKSRPRYRQTSKVSLSVCAAM